MVHDINLPTGDIEAYNIFVDALEANVEHNDIVQRFVVELPHLNYLARDGKPVILQDAKELFNYVEPEQDDKQRHKRCQTLFRPECSNKLKALITELQKNNDNEARAAFGLRNRIFMPCQAQPKAYRIEQEGLAYELTQLGRRGTWVRTCADLLAC
jgi:hypothetical protein